MFLIVSNIDLKDFILCYRYKFYFRDYWFTTPYSGCHRALDFVSSVFVLHTQEQNYTSISHFSPFEEVQNRCYTSNQPQIRHNNNKGKISNKVVTSTHYEAG